MNSDLSDFKKLYTEYAPFVRGVLFRLVGASQLDDAVQDCFFKAWKGRNGFKGDSSLKTWLKKIAVNTAIDLYRKKVSTEEVQDHHLVIDPQEVGVGQDINRAVMKLPMEYRVVVVSMIFEELSVKETSEALDIPEGTVKSRLSRGREMLQGMLKEMGYDYE